KAIDPVFFGELHLAFLYFGKSKIIITQFIRQVRLIMTIKIGKSPGYIRPFCKALAPPFIVFGNWMKLWKIKSNYLGRYGCWIYVLFTDRNVNTLLRCIWGGDLGRCTPNVSNADALSESVG